MLIPDLSIGWVSKPPGTGDSEREESWGIRLSMGEIGLVPRPPMWGTVRPSTGDMEWVDGDTIEWFPGELSDPKLERERVRIEEWSLFRSGSRRFGSGGGQELLQDLLEVSLYSSSLARAARLLRA